MQLYRVLLSALLFTASFTASAKEYGVYYGELKALKKAPETKQLFDEDAHQGLSIIYRDMITCKNLTPFQRWVRGTFLACDVVIVTPETMPKLYAYVDGICKKAHIITPTVFITRQDGFFNAFAQKLLMSSGGIVIGQKLLHDVSDNALEAVVAHEIGHIKHNHVNKGMAIGLGSVIILLPVLIKYFKLDELFMEIVNETRATTEALESVTMKESFDLMHKMEVLRSKLVLILIGISVVPAAIINKRFEKEADEFACKDNGKAAGTIELFELLLKKEDLREDEFVRVYELLQKNRLDLDSRDYYNLVIRYYLASFGHSCNKMFQYIYHNTFLGAHPSHEARIEAAKKYLQQEAQCHCC